MEPKVMRIEIKVTKTMIIVLAGLLLVALALLAMPSAGARPPLDGPGGQGEVTVASTVPTMISYQGQLLDSGGNLVPDGTYTMTFKLYNVPYEGETIWEETHPNVEVTDGLFNVLLGEYVSLGPQPEGEPHPFGIEDPTYLGVTVGSDPEMTPRQQMVSVPYAFVADTAKNGGGWTDDGTVVRLTTNTDNVCIGADDPNVKLHVLDNLTVANHPSILIEKTSTGVLSPRLGMVDTFTGDVETAPAWFIDNFRDQFRIYRQADISTTGPADQSLLIDNQFRVGIGTDTPSERLDVNGRVRVGDLPGGSGLNDIVVADSSGVLHKRDVTALSDADWYEVGTNAPPDDIADNIYTQGNVGIGTTTPGYNLHVIGSTRLENPVGNPGPDALYAFQDSDIGRAGHFVILDPGNPAPVLTANTLGTGPILDLQKNGGTKVRVTNDGSVGIGTDTPSQKLDVVGTAQMTGFKMPTGASNGLVLTSDAWGVGTWQAATGGCWQCPSTAVSLASGKDNVGIGTTTPDANYKLHVQGGNRGIYGVATAGTNASRPFGVVADVNTSASVISGGGFLTSISTSNTPGIGYVYGGQFWVNDDDNKNARTLTLGLDGEESNDYGLEILVDDPGYAIHSSGTGTVYFNGDVGIGTTTPQNKLDVEGAVAIGTDYSGTATAPADGMIVKGKVGIGTTDPWCELDVAGPINGYIRATRLSNAQACGFVLGSREVIGVNRWYILMPGSSEDLWFYDGEAPLIAEMVIKRGTGNVGIGMTNPTVKLDVAGDIHKTGTVSFVQPHPTDPTKEIVYVSLEGPEAGTYIRGTAQLVNGEAVISLSEHFSLVTNDEGLTVQLTPVGEWLQLYVVEKGTQRVIVREANGKNGQFDYLIQGVRKGYENHQVIQEKEARR